MAPAEYHEACPWFPPGLSLYHEVVGPSDRPSPDTSSRFHFSNSLHPQAYRSAVDSPLRHSMGKVRQTHLTHGYSW